MSYVELGDKIYRNEGKYEDAILSVEKAEQLWQSNPEQHRSPVYIGLGNVYHDNQVYEKAITYHQLGLNELKILVL